MQDALRESVRPPNDSSNFGADPQNCVPFLYEAAFLGLSKIWSLDPLHNDEGRDLRGLFVGNHSVDIAIA